MATIKDVAKLAGVAISTVSYALNDSHKITETTKRKVEEAARTLNYQKNGFASDLKKTKTNTLALILSDLSGPYYSELIKGVQDVTSSNGFDLIACSSVGGPHSTAVKFLSEKRVDGAIILAHNIKDEVAIQAANSTFPIVVMDRTISHDHIYEVEVDNTEGAFQATVHLIEKGHTKIGYIGGPPASRDSELRYKGFRQALETYHLHYYSKWEIAGNFTKEGGYQAVKLLITQGELPSAIFFANDEMAIGGIMAFKEKKIAIPQDISIIGFDDIELAAHISVPLTTVRQPKYEAGSLATHLIFQLLKKEKIKKHYMLSTEIIERGSTAFHTSGSNKI